MVIKRRKKPSSSCAQVVSFFCQTNWNQLNCFKGRMQNMWISVLTLLCFGVLSSHSSPIDVTEDESIETSGGNEYYDDEDSEEAVVAVTEAPAPTPKRSLSFAERKKKYLSMSPEERKRFLNKVRRFRAEKLRRRSKEEEPTTEEDPPMTLKEEEEIVDSLYGLPEEVRAEILEKEKQGPKPGVKRDKKERRKLRKRKEFRKLFREFMEWQEDRERRRRQRRRRRRKMKKRQKGGRGNARRRNANLLKKTIENLMRLSAVEKESE